jgi:DNA-binding CsgD family transcriptional regulator
LLVRREAEREGAMPIERPTLAGLAARMVETLDALKVGVVLASADSRILYANRAAQEMMRDGGPLRDCGGVLRAEGGAASAEIRAAIRRAAHSVGGIRMSGSAVRLTGEGEVPVVARVLPLAGGEVEPAAVVAVFINPAVDDAASARAVSAAFGLTPAETRVLGRVLSGSSVAEAAAGLGVAASTARTHLDSIFAKTGVSRQYQLLRLAAQITSATR